MAVMIVNSEQGIEYSLYEGRLNLREAFVRDWLSLRSRYRW
jgi:hypothetical protein